MCYAILAYYKPTVHQQLDTFFCDTEATALYCKSAVTLHAVTLGPQLSVRLGSVLAVLTVFHSQHTSRESFDLEKIDHAHYFAHYNIDYVHYDFSSSSVLTTICYYAHYNVVLCSLRYCTVLTTI